MSDIPAKQQLHSSLADKFLYGLVTSLLRLLSLLPLACLLAIGVCLGQLLWWFNTSGRRVTEINLEICFPHLSSKQRRVLARRSVIESAKTLIEVVVIWISPLAKNKKLIKRVTGAAYLDEALQKKQSVIILAPHLGNWEVLGIFFTQQIPFTVMYAPAKINTLGKIMFAGRERFGCKLTPTNTQGVRTLLKALKMGESIGILPDQVPDPEGGEFAPFFGEPALTMTLIATLAARTGAKVLCGYAKRLQDEAGFEICLRPAADNIASENLQDAVVALNQSVEACVKDCPEQYQWEYKRFKRRPTGQPKLY